MQIGTNGDGKVSGSPKDLQSADMADVFETLAVHLEDLVASFQTHFFRFRTFFHFGDKDTEPTFESSQDAEMKYFVTARPGERHRPGPRFRGAGKIQHPQLSNEERTHKLG